MEYGSSHNKLRQLFAQYNGTWVTSTADARVTFPAAPEWSFNVDLSIPETTDVKGLLVTAMGVAGPKTIASVAKATGIQASRVLDRSEGSRIVLPYVSKVVSYRVRSQFRESIENILEVLRKSDDAIEILEAGEMFGLSPHADSLAATLGNCFAAPQPLGSYCGDMNLESIPFRQRTRVAILDSGVPENDNRFQFWKNAAEADGNRWEDDDKNEFEDDIIGVNMITRRGYPLDDVTVPDKLNHGTHVAGIASCRLGPQALRQEIDRRLELMVLKVADRNGRIEPAAVTEAVAYAMRYGARVINMSFEGRYSLAVETFIRSAKDIIFVTAAGNGSDGVGADLAARKVYPARYAEALPNVISVAAHNANRDLACFSNFGRGAVDIAAPGLGVPSTVANGTTALSGTSQAAPLVALAAALLISSGVEDPVAIRNRLLYTADFAPSLRGKVRSDGVLNIRTALAYDMDVVRLRSGEVIFGTIQNPQTIAVGGLPEELPLNRARRILVGYSTTPGQRSKIVFDTPSGTRDILVDFTSPQLTVRADGAIRTIAGEEIVEIIPSAPGGYP
jgi:subtilisin family serine protease